MLEIKMGRMTTGDALMVALLVVALRVVLVVFFFGCFSLRQRGLARM
jgi:hypothetical protein